MADVQQTIIDEVIKLLQGGNAHAGLDDALENLPPEQRSAKPHNLPYSIWQLVEHIRIAQWDMLEFCRDASHQSPKWPDEYWPQEAGPASEEAWNQSLQQIEADTNALVNLVKTRDLYEPLPHGDGQNILREALQAADHTAYHVAEIILLRRLLGSWRS